MSSEKRLLCGGIAMKKGAAFCLSAIMGWILCLSVTAANAGKFLRTNYEITGNVLQIMGSELPPGGELMVTIGTQKEVSASFLTVAEAELPTTVYCLVDVSGSMNQEQLAQVQDVLLAISDNMAEGDNMVLASLGDKVAIGELLATKEQREAAIGGLQSGSAYTNLYQGVMDSIELLSTNMSYHRSRCLIILSDGEDDHQTGATREEAMEAIRASTVPVYAVATLRADASAAAREYGKELRSFATVSLGGQGYTPVLDEMDSTEVGNAIWTSMQGNSVINVILDGLVYDSARDSLLLRATYETTEAKYEDTMTLYTVDLTVTATQQPIEEPEATEASPLPTEVSEAAEPPLPTGASEAAASPLPTEAPVLPQEDFPWWIVVVSAMVLAAMVIIVLVVRKKMRKQEQPSEEGSREVAERDSGEEKKADVKKPEMDISVHRSEEKSLPGGGCRVTLTAIGYEEKCFTFVLPVHCAKTLGRNNKADIILDGADNRLSGVHCELEWNGTRLYIRDKQSTNGSFVNGVTIQEKSWMPLENSSTLRIGTYEYRVRLEKL